MIALKDIGMISARRTSRKKRDLTPGLVIPSSHLSKYLDQETHPNHDGIMGTFENWDHHSFLIKKIRGHEIQTHHRDHAR